MKSKNKTTFEPDIALNTVMIDWVTYTWYDSDYEEGYEYAKKAFLEIEPFFSEPDYLEEKTIGGYSGWYCAAPSGTIFMGCGTQKKSGTAKEQAHSMIRVSGALAHFVFFHPFFATCIRGKDMRCTRLDVQVTVQQPISWDMDAVLIDLMQMGHTVIPASSYDKIAQCRLMTIYIGKRTSMRFVRLYQKVATSGDVLLRFEAEYKKERASQMAANIERNGDMMGKYLAFEVESTKNERVQQCFSGQLPLDAAVTERIKRAKDIDKTWEWISGVVIPVLDRYLRQHMSPHSKELRDTLHLLLAQEEEGNGE